MSTVILRQRRLILFQTVGCLSHFHKSRACLSILNNVTEYLQNKTGSTRLLSQIKRFGTTCRNPSSRSTLFMTGTACNINNSIMKQRTQHFTLGKVMLKPLDDKDVKKSIESLTDKFMEARELLSDARESEGTVYFTEDMEEAQQAVRETIEEYSNLLSKLSEKQRQDVVRTIGLKMEELKAQLQAMLQELKEEH